MNMGSYAVQGAEFEARVVEEPPCPYRSAYERDRDRIIHAKAFRRLKHKTQVLVDADSDHCRSRLTHTLEVAQVSRHLARQLCVNEDLSECIALAHDLGHTPFGHAGERTLNSLLAAAGGFEHNRHSLRIVDELEDKYPNFDGLNLTKAVRYGLLKPGRENPFGTDHFHSIEAQIVDISDEIAYLTADIDDGISQGFIAWEALVTSLPFLSRLSAEIRVEFPLLSAEKFRNEFHRRLMHQCIQNCLNTTRETIRIRNVKSIDDVQAQNDPIVSFSPEFRTAINGLRAFLLTNFYFHPDVYRHHYRGQHIIRALFTMYTSDVRLLPRRVQAKMVGNDQHRYVGDYIAGMTDNFAHKEYMALWIPTP